MGNKNRSSTSRAAIQGSVVPAFILLTTYKLVITAKRNLSILLFKYSIVFSMQIKNSMWVGRHGYPDDHTLIPPMHTNVGSSQLFVLHFYSINNF